MMTRLIKLRRGTTMRIIFLILVLVPLIFQTGCWNAREINELAFVMTIALDTADDGFRVTAQIAKPETYSKTPTGSVGAAEKEKPFWVVSSTGKSIFEAVRNMAAVSPRRIFWSHIKVIIIGEELARNNVLEMLDFFTRNPELRLRTWIAVTEGKAAAILDIKPMMEKDPSFNIERIIDKTNISGKAYRIMLKNFLEEYLHPYLDPVASRLVVTSENSMPVVKLEGASVFSDNNLVGWLTEIETRGLLWAKNNINGSTRVVECPYDGLPVTLEIKKAKTNIKSSLKDGVLQFTINATADGKITEQGCTTKYTDPQALQALSKALEAAIYDDIQSVVTASKNFGSDIIGFSHVFHRQHKNEWRQLSSNWDQSLKNAQINIEVKVRIPEVSLLAKPLVPNKNPD